MNVPRLSAHDHRVFAIGAGIILGLLTVARGLPAWRAWRTESRARAIVKVSESGQNAAVLRAFPQTLDTLQARTTRLKSVTPLLLSGENRNAAASNLSTLVAQMARESSVRLESVSARIDSSHDVDLSVAIVEVQGTADIAGIAAILQRVERGPFLLGIRHLEVHPQNPTAAADQPELLSFRMTIQGLILLASELRAHAVT